MFKLKTMATDSPSDRFSPGLRLGTRIGLIASIVFALSVSAQEPTRKLLVGTEYGFYPFADIDGEGRPQGFSVDLFRAVARKMDLEIEFQIGTWKEILTAIEQKQIDALPFVKHTERRDGFLDFSITHIVEHAVTIKRRDGQSIESPKDMSGKDVVVMEADGTHLYMAAHVPAARLSLVPTVSDALRSLAAGNHDYAVVPRTVGLVKIRDLDLDNRLLPTGPLMEAYARGFSFGVQDGDRETLAILNEGLNLVKESGEYDEIYNRWFGEIDPRSSAEELKRRLLYGVAGILLVALIAAVWLATLRRLVIQRTTELREEIEERKQAEIELQQAYSENERLRKRLEAESAYLRDEIIAEHDFEHIIGKSDAIKTVFHKMEQVSVQNTSVLILGETGTGKELIARAIHNLSPRRDRPLIKVNCATLPAHLVESELFGHERGAFTGAQARRLGRFELADKATLFLDEIGELPLDLQAKLLRVLEDGEFERIGDTRTLRVDVRILAATNRQLELEVQNGGFRADLWYRLKVYPITVPPLRERVEDIPLLMTAFLNQFNKRMGKSVEIVPEHTMHLLRDYSWPGNVRELKNVVERGVINSSGPKLRLAEKLKPPRPDLPAPLRPLDEVERDHIVRVLEETTWRIDGPKGAALILGLNASTLRSRMRKLGIQKP